MTDMIRLLFAVTFLLTTSADVWAQKRVAVSSFEGDRGGSVAAAAVTALEDEFKVIAPKAVMRVADELAVAVGDKDAEQLLTELEADVLVMGIVKKADGGHKLTLRVVTKGGKKARSAHVLYGKKANNARVRRGIRTAVSTIVEASAEEAPAEEPERSDKAVRGKRGRDADAGADEASAKPSKRGERDKASDSSEGEARPSKRADRDSDIRDADADAMLDKRSKSKGKAPADAAEGDAEAGAEADAARDDGADDKALAGFNDDEDPDEGERKSSRADVEASVSKRSSSSSKKAPLAARVSVGPSVTNRTLEFSHRAFQQAPRDYSGGVVPGARAQGEVYPLAFGGSGLLANLGIGFSFDQSIGLKVNTGGMKLATTMRNYAVDARVRLPLGGVQVMVVGGYARRTFKIDRGGAAVDLPDVDYKMFNPGLGFSIPLGRVAVFLEGRALLVTSAGPIERPSSYGQAKVTAFEGEGGVEIGITKRIGVRLVGNFVGVGYTFKGTGAMSNNRDDDSASKDVGGAAERYISGALTASVLY
jgi:hypothetical protein